MPTKAKTKKKPLNIAEIKGTQPILAFDKEGNIDVFLFDDTEFLDDSLGLDKSLQIPLAELANANILFQISDQLKLMPGESEKDDQAIITLLKNKISDNITTPWLVTSEIIASWEKIASHPLFKRYEAFRESKGKMPLAYIGAYEASLHDYIAGYLSTLVQHESTEKWIFAHTAELVKSTFDGRDFHIDPIDKMNSLLSLSEECSEDIPYSQKIFDTIKARLQREQQGALQTTAKRDLLSLAHSNQPADAQLLLMTLLDDNQHVSPKLLQSIAKASKNESVIDVSRLLLQMQKSEEKDAPSSLPGIIVAREPVPNFTVDYDSKSRGAKSEKGRQNEVEDVKDIPKEKKKKTVIK